ncbi:MAG: methyl-accepting chemotaxis protein [Hyphomicrobiales bacterium]
MASEASWQTSTAGKRDPFAADEPMDQRTVESLLRRLVDRVEESERRYGEALDELHARLDQLSQTTEAVRDTGAPEDADTFDRLHTQVSDLARRLEHESAAPLDDFERLGRALSNSLDQGMSQDEPAPAPHPYGGAPEPSPFAQAAMFGKMPEVSQGSHISDFDYDVPEETVPPVATTEADDTDLDKRLVEMAQRLEQSIGSAMPTSAIESLNARLDEIGGQLSQALERAPTREAIEHIEHQISDMAQQLSRAEGQLSKVAGIEQHLIKLIERVDEKASAQNAGQLDETKLQEIASNAATEAARLVAGDASKSAERLDALHRDITAMSTKSRESGDRLVSTLEAVHESLKQLVQQVERGAPLQAKVRAPFSAPARQTEAKLASPLIRSQAAASAAPAKAPEMAAAPVKSEGTAQSAAKGSTLRERLGGAIPEPRSMKLRSHSATPSVPRPTKRPSISRGCAAKTACTRMQNRRPMPAWTPRTIVAAARPRSAGHQPFAPRSVADAGCRACFRAAGLPSNLGAASVPF